jgi:uncharacterized membrane protein YgcG
MKHTPVLIALLASLCIPVVHAQTPEAVIQRVSGKVEIQAPGSPAWVPASAGMVIEAQTRISTWVKSSAVIVWGGATIMVRPVTMLTLEEITVRQGEEQAEIYLHTGRVRAEVTRPRGGTIGFTVQSPMLVASVRGTAFEFDTINLVVFNGEVQYTSMIGSRVLVRAGEGSTLDEKIYVVTPPREEIILTYTPPLPPGSEAGGRLNGDGPITVRDGTGGGGGGGSGGGSGGGGSGGGGSGWLVTGGW